MITCWYGHSRVGLAIEHSHAPTRMGSDGMASCQPANHDQTIPWVGGKMVLFLYSWRIGLNHPISHTSFPLSRPVSISFSLSNFLSLHPSSFVLPVSISFLFCTSCLYFLFYLYFLSLFPFSFVLPVLISFLFCTSCFNFLSLLYFLSPFTFSFVHPVSISFLFCTSYLNLLFLLSLFPFSFVLTVSIYFLFCSFCL
jgi:hypothetical protein